MSRNEIFVKNRVRITNTAQGIKILSGNSHLPKLMENHPSARKNIVLSIY